ARRAQRARARRRRGAPPAPRRRRPRARGVRSPLRRRRAAGRARRVPGEATAALHAVGVIDVLSADAGRDNTLGKCEAAHTSVSPRGRFTWTLSMVGCVAGLAAVARPLERAVLPANALGLRLATA